MVVTQLQLARRAEHAVAFLAADLARLERDGCAGNEAAGRREDALHAGARSGGAAHDRGSTVAIGAEGYVDESAKTVAQSSRMLTTVQP